MNINIHIFSHPDFTVGFGITPNRPPKRFADCTAGRELHPTPKIIVFVTHNKHIPFVCQELKMAAVSEADAAAIVCFDLLFLCLCRLVFGKGCTLTKRGIQNFLSHTKMRRCYFQKFVRIDEVDGLLQA